jgi:redox-sensitive bicupin YhaK (pirin superfamily)
MTAGRGLIHSEMPEQTDGLAWGFQLWLNLPKKHKMTDPKYQDLPSEALPVAGKDGVRVKVLAGEWGGAKSPGVSFIPFTYLDVELAPGAVFEAPAPKDRNAFLYAYEGKVEAGPEKDATAVAEGFLGVLGKGEKVRVQATGGKAKFLFASALALNEPVVRGGPFVMNTMAELKQAFYDYETGVLR